MKCSRQGLGPAERDRDKATRVVGVSFYIRVHLRFSSSYLVAASLR